MNHANLEIYKAELFKKKANLMNIVQRAESQAKEPDTFEGAEDFLDKAVSLYGKEFLLTISNKERATLRQIEAAIDRIDRGTYGTCANCVGPIPSNRLKAVPWAELCISCQELQEEGRL